MCKMPLGNATPPLVGLTQILPQHKPSCILSQYEVCYMYSRERGCWMPPLFFLLLDTRLFETLLVHPCTVLPSGMASHISTSESQSFRMVWRVLMLGKMRLGSNPSKGVVLESGIVATILCRDFLIQCRSRKTLVFSLWCLSFG